MVVFSDVTPDWAGVEIAFKKGDEAAKRVTAHFGGRAIAIEREKVYWPYYLMRKKRYLAIKYLGPDSTKSSRDIKGFDTQRRDTVEFVAIILNRMLSAILDDRSPDRAITILREFLAQMAANEFPLAMYIMSKSLKSTYKNPESQVQAVVAAKIEKRNPGEC
jgi:DNA polymerase elongation subunit (family B)